MNGFVTQEDYVVIGKPALDILTQSTEDNRLLAEAMAEEEIAGYLRGRYDVSAVFASQYTDRNQKIVGIYCDITLYHLISWLPQRMGYEIREKRYEKAIEWLQAVQAGRIVPDLPTPQESETQETAGSTPIRYGSMKKNNYNW